MKEYRFGKIIVMVDEPTITIYYDDNLEIYTQVYATRHEDYYVNIRVITRNYVLKEHYGKTIVKETHISWTGREAEKRYNAIKKTIQLLKQRQKLQVIP